MAAESDEWIKKLPCGWTVRYSYQLLNRGYSASAEILEPADAVIVYTHIQKDSAVPASREEIEAQFVDELSPLQSNTD